MAHLRVADFGGRGRQQRHVLPQHVAVLDVVVAGEPADGDVVARVADVGELGHVADVDEHGGSGQPQLHEREERVPAGEELGVVAVLGEQRDRLLHGIGTRVAELGGDHLDAPLIASEPAMTARTMLW